MLWIMQSSDDFFERFSTVRKLPAEEDLGGGFYRLKVEEAEKRQARHDIRSVEDALLELLRNSRDAQASHIAVASSLREKRFRYLTVIDNGQGIPPDYHQVVFEPRVTSRIREFHEDEYGVHGRGMALFAIRSHAEEIRVAHSIPYGGTSIRAIFDLERLPEKKNQMERPRLARSKDGFELKGVRNIQFVLYDFALKHPGINIYYGSPAEILRLILTEPAFAGLVRLSGLKGESADDVREAARTLGLDISSRHAYRVCNGQTGMPAWITAIFSRAAGGTKFAFSTPRFVRQDWEKIKQEIKTVLQPYNETYGFVVVSIKQHRSRDSLKITVVLEESERLG